MTQPPPYGVPPQQGHPGQAPPPAYLGGGAPGFPAPYGAPPGHGGPRLPPPPANKPRTVGLVTGLITAVVLIAFAVIVLLVTL